MSQYFVRVMDRLEVCEAAILEALAFVRCDSGCAVWLELKLVRQGARVVLGTFIGIGS
ncbi:hypothetical protein D3C77_523180 [compost metagenome]